MNKKEDMKRTGRFLGLRALISLALVLAMTLTFTFADKTSDELEEEIEQNNQQSEQLEEQMSEKQGEIDGIKSRISEVSGEISDLKAQIADNEEKLEQQQKELDRNAKNLDKRLRNMYKNGSIGFIDVILSSENVADLITNVELVARIYSGDRELVDALQDQYDETMALQTALKEQQIELSGKIDELTLQQEMLYDEFETLGATKEEVDAQTASLQSELQIVQEEEARRAEEARQAEEARRAEEARQAEQAQQQDDGNDDSSSDDDDSSGGTEYSSAEGQDLVSYACQFTGVPYVWGGTSPSGWDCSGFVQYVYRQYGVYLPRTSYEQGGCGTAVPNGQQQPGDLVCYGGHVGIYIGNGQLIHASSPGVGTVIYPLSYRGGYWFRRVL